MTAASNVSAPRMGPTCFTAKLRWNCCNSRRKIHRFCWLSWNKPSSTHKEVDGWLGSRKRRFFVLQYGSVNRGHEDNRNWGTLFSDKPIYLEAPKNSFWRLKHWKNMSQSFSIHNPTLLPTFLFQHVANMLPIISSPATYPISQVVNPATRGS
jgi:hypothetical protein